MPIERLEVTTRDPREATSLLQQAYASDGEMTYHPATGAVDLSFDLRQSGELHAGRLHHSTITSAELTPVPYLLVGTVLQGRLWCEQAEGAPATAVAGEAMLYPVSGRRREMGWDDLELALVRIPLDAVDRAAQEQYGRRAGGFAFDDIAPLDRVLERQWAALSRFLFTQLAAADTLLERTGPQEQMVGLLAAAAVMTFPHAFVEDHHARPGAVGVRTVRRAARLIEENATEPLTLSDIATAVGADPVALRIAFRSEYAVSPMRYLRRARLELAYSELSLGGADDRETVADVAVRAGFVSLSGFRSAFVKRFGTTPGRVLLEGRGP